MTCSGEPVASPAAQKVTGRSATKDVPTRSAQQCVLARSAVQHLAQVADFSALPRSHSFIFKENGA